MCDEVATLEEVLEQGLGKSFAPEESVIKVSKAAEVFARKGCRVRGRLEIVDIEVGRLHMVSSGLSQEGGFLVFFTLRCEEAAEAKPRTSLWALKSHGLKAEI